jgi:hypothetical protein
MRTRKDWLERLMHDIYHERAVLFNQAGSNTQAKREFEWFYQDEFVFKDVSVQVGRAQ